MKKLTLRSRLTLLTAAAVAVAVAAVALAAWFITRDQLVAQLDSTLHSTHVDNRYLNQTLVTCASTAQTSGNVPPGAVGIQIVKADGTRCLGVGAPPVKVQARDIEVASGTVDTVTHDARTDSGQEVRVFTEPLLDGPDGQATGLAVSISRPLTEIDKTLTTLAWVLLAVAGVGVLGATSAGLWIARTGLRPVDELAGTVEHIARTEDLSVRIPVEGEDEIARLGQSFNAMTSALASSRDRQQQLIADAGHELRTPLTSLRTNIELLERSEATGRAIPPEDRRALLASVKAQMTELAALIGDLQELSRPDAAPTLQVVPLHEITGTALERARLRGPDLTISADVSPWFVRGEAAALERAIVNLLDNAVKFSPPAGRIDVRLHGGRLTVRDHGPGIPAEELPHVFERFWRSPSARSLPGSGLGLSIVARTVHQAGGTIALTPAQGGGTEAALYLPGAPTAPPDAPPEP
ncbi:HAMP domain-containing histidine kinase [Streptomyces cocklensis]|uniref:histidine kinase n=1 Tax=Actinacidiphila cocklensis TaxID=887465 RepID=A0A9W4GPE7_9ACTN|nr:HAMP domain-containing sensor histidine kinase [Actinacidiphila cocklensis]MDD1061664.1 HAMP domain-containing histidine kinase [Actinacidiphila cocklensis]WSX77701.1 HAMP domain-containing histidine kinase [Streptomyces sp. NBC_00899]CAG6392415.1 Histidine kinase [Actinacidiphila cocklensis]